MQKSNFPLSYPMTARTFLEKNGFLNKEQYEDKLAQEGRPDALLLDYPKQPLAFEEITDKPNILMITVSGLRYDAVVAEKMPKLYDFAQKSTSFTNHYSSGNNNNAGLSGLFYGLNANYIDSLLNNRTSSVFIEKLLSENYGFGLFSATNFKSSIFRQALFQKQRLEKSQKSNQSAVENLAVFLSLTENKQPWFAYVDLDIAQKVREQELTSLEKEQTYYGQQLAQLDDLLGRIFVQLETQGLMDNTMVIITAEHGYTFQMTQDELTHYFARDEIQVPMIIRWSGLTSGEKTKLSSHIDLIPALMNSVFKVKNSISDYSQGANLFDQKRTAEWVFASNHRWNVIITPDGTQYHIDKRGNYQKFDRTYQEISSGRPPLGLFLEAFNRDRSFLGK